jgi:hypothetical protein
VKLSRQIKAVLVISLLSICSSCTTTTKGTNEIFEGEDQYVDTVVIESENPVQDFKKIYETLARMGYTVEVMNQDFGLINTAFKKWSDADRVYEERVMVNFVDGRYYFSAEMQFADMQFKTFAKNYGGEENVYNASWRRIKQIASSVALKQRFMLRNDFVHF